MVFFFFDKFGLLLFPLSNYQYFYDTLDLLSHRTSKTKVFTSYLEATTDL